MDAFGADVLVYAAVGDPPLGRRVRQLFRVAEAPDGVAAGVGSVLLLPELLSQPLRDDRTDDLDELGQLLGRLDLRPVDEAVAQIAAALRATYRSGPPTQSTSPRR